MNNIGKSNYRRAESLKEIAEYKAINPSQSPAFITGRVKTLLLHKVQVILNETTESVMET